MDSLSHKTRIVSRYELKREGFDDEQIETLEHLREQYPFVEFLDSRQEWHRLAFMKWLIEHREKAKTH